VRLAGATIRETDRYVSKRARRPLARSAPILPESRRNHPPVTRDNNIGSSVVTGRDDTRPLDWRKIEKLPSSVPEDSFSESDAIFNQRKLFANSVANTIELNAYKCRFHKLEKNHNELNNRLLLTK